MRLRTLGATIAGLIAIAAPARADVRVTIENGHVTVLAHDATLRQILVEWARVGQTRIVNAERLAGPPLTIELDNVPEADALDTLLRPVSGYLAAPRANPVAHASQYDRIFLLPASTGAPPRPPTPAAAASRVVFPQANATQNGGAVDDDRPIRPRGVRVPPNAPSNVVEPSVVAPSPNGARGPNTVFAQPQFQRVPATTPPPSSQPQSYAAPTAPIGVARPGMPVPVPAPAAQQPGQPPASPDQEP